MTGCQVAPARGLVSTDKKCTASCTRLMNLIHLIFHLATHIDSVSLWEDTIFKIASWFRGRWQVVICIDKGDLVRWFYKWNLAVCWAWSFGRLLERSLPDVHRCLEMLLINICECEPFKVSLSTIHKVFDTLGLRLFLLPHLLFVSLLLFLHPFLL